MESTQINDIERRRKMAESLDCFIEEDFKQLAGSTDSTTEAWRKRGTGPAYIRLGNRYLYPRKAVAKYLESITRERLTPRKSAL